MHIMHILFLAALTLAIAAPFDKIGPLSSIVRLEPPSDEAAEIANSNFYFVTSNGKGCPETISHKEVGPVADDQSADVEGFVTFGNITVNGAPCNSGEEDEVLVLYSQDVLNFTFTDASVLNLSYPAYRSVFVGGADVSPRKCGDYEDSEVRRYAFTKDIGVMLDSLVEQGFIDNSTVRDEYRGDGMWMLSAPPKSRGLICLYLRDLPDISLETPAPIGEPEEEPDVEGIIDDDEGIIDDGEEDDPESDPVLGPDIPNLVFVGPEEISADPDDDDDDGVCFAASSSVRVDDGSVKLICDVNVGDRVHIGNGVFSEVFMFTHKLSSGMHTFVKIDTTSGHTLSATASHYVYINGRLATAGTVAIGDALELGNGTMTHVKAVKRVRSRGLYNPQTIHGDIVVNDIRASTYTQDVQPAVAHALLMPLRALYMRFSYVVGLLDNGASSLLWLVPNGRARY